jgi:hypothetical protein
MSVGKKMKKIALVLSLFLTACAFGTNDKTEFKNPIFNLPLSEYYNDHELNIYEYLTPKSIDYKYQSKEIFYPKERCVLIENEQDYITLKCNGTLFNGLVRKVYKTYVIDSVISEKCLRIFYYLRYNIDERLPDKDEIGYYCVTPPKDMLLEKNTQLKSD